MPNARIQLANLGVIVAGVPALLYGTHGSGEIQGPIGIAVLGGWSPAVVSLTLAIIEGYKRLAAGWHLGRHDCRHHRHLAGGQLRKHHAGYRLTPGLHMVIEQALEPVIAHLVVE